MSLSSQLIMWVERKTSYYYIVCFEEESTTKCCESTEANLAKFRGSGVKERFLGVLG